MDNIEERYNKLFKIVIKDNISDEDKNIVCNEFKKIYDELVLFLISRKDIYYGYFLMNMELFINFDKDVIAGVSIMDKFPFILEVNPILLLRFNLNEIMFILCHEIEHLVLSHPSICLKLNPKMDSNTMLLLNYAADASVNEILIKDMKSLPYLSMPPSLITSKTIKEIANINDIANDESVIYYYNLIKDKKINKRIRFGLINSKSGGEFNYKYSKDENYISEMINEFIKKIVNQIPENVLGNLPMHQKIILNNVLKKPKLKWQNLLKLYLGNIPHNYKKTKMRLNRRMPLRYDLSGHITDYTIKLVIAVDTSGSIDEKMFCSIFGEIFGIVKNIKCDITLIQCDCKIKSIDKIKSLNDIKYQVSGGGGTRFSPVIEYLNQHPEYRDAILIYFTDGYGEKEINDYEKPVIKKLSKEEIDAIHAKGEITPEEWVREVEECYSGFCPFSNESTRCNTFKDCTDCLIEYANTKESFGHLFNTDIALIFSQDELNCLNFEKEKRLKI